MPAVQRLDADSRCRCGVRGMTMIEVLIAITLIALLGGALLLGPGMLSSSRQRAAATLILSSVRVAQARANTTGRPVRIVFDLDQHRLVLEQSSSSVMLREHEPGTGAGAEPATEAERLAREEANQILEGPRAPRPRFSPIKAVAEEDGKGGPGRALGSGIQFGPVQTEHDEEPVLSGRAYLYFWPRGGTERAAIQVRRKGEIDGLTVLVSALTGRARIERGAVPLPQSRSDGEEYSEREEEL